jgi:hypothetical protein
VSFLQSGFLVTGLTAPRSTGLDDRPIKGLDIPVSSDNEAPTSPIPRKARKSEALPAQTNGRVVNGKHAASDDLVGSASKKRTISEALDDESPGAKKLKKQSNGNGATEVDDFVVIEDDAAIVIDD